MILAKASCGHFCLFDPDEDLLYQPCRCESPVYVAPGTEAVLATARIHRTTSSSRKPGKKIEGDIHVTVRTATGCPKCNRPMWNDVGIHGYRRTAKGPVDCMDQPVEVAHG